MVILMYLTEESVFWWRVALKLHNKDHGGAL